MFHEREQEKQSMALAAVPVLAMMLAPRHLVPALTIVLVPM
jgi:hypothetical protein